MATRATEARKGKQRLGERVEKVFDVIAAATKEGRTISSAEVSSAVGFSEPQVKSTINTINKTMHEFGMAGSRMIAFHGARPQEGQEAGWMVATSRDEWIGWHGTLHKHATTRVESLMRFSEVMDGLWGDESPQPGLLSRLYENARDILDTCTKVMTPRTKPTGAPKRARRAVRQIR